METLRRQASKFREQVSKQQQAVLKQFVGHNGNDDVVADEAELWCHQQLERLYHSTRAAKHFQRDFIRGVEAQISTSSKQMDIARKLVDDCCRYGNENQSAGTALARGALYFGTSRNLMEKEREDLQRVLGVQVSEPLRAMVTGAPLEDARHLTQRYERIRLEVEAQALEVARRQLKSKEASASAESAIKLQNAESKLTELRSTLSALGKEATSAMMSVESQQQRLTFQRLVSMVDAERSYHQSVADILDKLHGEMMLERQRGDSAAQSPTAVTDVYVPAAHNEDNNSTKSGDLHAAIQNSPYHIAEVVHAFDAQAEGELSLSVGDYVVVRQVSPHGWSEGECKGKAGWFPSAYIERREKAPASKITEVSPSS